MSAPNFEAITFTAYPEKTATFVADAEANRRAIEAQEPFLSRHYHAGDLHVPQEMLDQVIQECAALPGAATISFYGEEQHRMGHHEHISPFLDEFLAAAETRLRDFVHMTTGFPSNKLISSAQAGPYHFIPDNEWHCDTREPFGRTYLVTLFGQATEFSSGSYEKHQFDVGDELLPSIVPHHTNHSSLGQITLHHAATTVHRAPPESYKGTNRCLISCLTE